MLAGVGEKVPACVCLTGNGRIELLPPVSLVDNEESPPPPPHHHHPPSLQSSAHLYAAPPPPQTIQSASVPEPKTRDTRACQVVAL